MSIADSDKIVGESGGDATDMGIRKVLSDVGAECCELPHRTHWAYAVTMPAEVFGCTTCPFEEGNDLSIALPIFESEILCVELRRHVLGM